MQLYSAEYRDEVGKQKITLRVNDNGADREIVINTDLLKQKVYNDVFDSIALQDITAEVQAETAAEASAIASSTVLSDEEKNKYTIGLQSIETQKRIATTVKNRIASARAADEANQQMADYLSRLGNVFGVILSDAV
jgi:hypothetical protein